jgi:hypothetical protein
MRSMILAAAMAMAAGMEADERRLVIPRPAIAAAEPRFSPPHFGEGQYRAHDILRARMQAHVDRLAGVDFGAMPASRQAVRWATRKNRKMADRAGRHARDAEALKAYRELHGSPKKPGRTIVDLVDEAFALAGR